MAGHDQERGQGDQRRTQIISATIEAAITRTAKAASGQLTAGRGSRRVTGEPPCANAL